MEISDGRCWLLNSYFYFTLEKGFNMITIDSLIVLLAIDRLYSSSASKLNFSKSQLKFLKGDVRDVSFLRKVF